MSGVLTLAQGEALGSGRRAGCHWQQAASGVVRIFGPGCSLLPVFVKARRPHRPFRAQIDALHARVHGRNTGSKLQAGPEAHSCPDAACCQWHPAVNRCDIESGREFAPDDLGVLADGGRDRGRGLGVVHRGKLEVAGGRDRVGAAGRAAGRGRGALSPAGPGPYGCGLREWPQHSGISPVTNDATSPTPRHDGKRLHRRVQ